MALHHARVGGRDGAVAAHHLGLHPVRGALRQVRRHVRLDRRDDRAAHLALPDRAHLRPRRGGPRPPPGPPPPGESARRPRRPARAPPPPPEAPRRVSPRRGGGPPPAANPAAPAPPP